MALIPQKKRSQRSQKATWWRYLNISSFLRWWGQGLLLWLPVSWRRRMDKAGKRFAIVADMQEIRVFDEKGTKRQEIACYSRAKLQAGDWPQRLLQVGERQVVLRLAPQLALCNNVTLPQAAEKNLRQALGFEIDRLTPFRSEQVFFDAKVIAKLPENRQLRVRLGLVLRDKLTPLLAQLKRLGLSPQRVEIVTEGELLNLLPTEDTKRGLSPSQRMRRLLLLLLIIAGLAAMILPLWQQRSLAVHLIPLVDKAEVEAQQVIVTRNRLDKAIKSSQFLLNKRQQTVLLVDLLNELTTILPDNTYLEQISLRTGRLELRGQSSDATSLIGIVEQSQLFQGANFPSPVVKDNRTKLDRFVLTATVIPMAASGGQPDSAHTTSPTSILNQTQRLAGISAELNQQ